MIACGWHPFCGRPAGHDGDCEIWPERGFQEDFLAVGADGALGGGKVGGGKSAALLMEALRHIGNPTYEALLLRKVKDDLIKPGGLWPKSKALYPAFGGVEHETALFWEFPSKARIYFGYVDPHRYKEQWRGAQAAFLAFDELPQFTRSEFVYLLSRNRTSCGVKPYWRAVCNPDPDSWLRSFVDWWIAKPDYPGAVIGHPELTDGPAGWPRADRAGVTRFYVRRGGDEIWGDTPQEVAVATGEPLDRVKSFCFLTSSEVIKHLPGYESSVHEQDHAIKLQLLGNWDARDSAGRPFPAEWVLTPGGAPRQELLIDAEPADLWWLRSWDLAATAASEARTTGSWSAGIKMALQDDRLIIGHALIERGDEGQVEEWVTKTAADDGYDTRIWLCREKAGAGKAQLGRFQRLLKGYEVDGEPETGKKAVRLGPLVPFFKSGRVRLVRGSWNQRFLAHLTGLPGPPDDVGDALAAGLQQLAEKSGRVTIKQVADSLEDAMDAFKQARATESEWPW